MTENIVELIRRFAPISHRTWEWDFLLNEHSHEKRWHEIEEEHRVLVIADPGAGKTFEAKTRARRLRDRGKNAFFIPIELLDANFDHAFELGSTNDFAAWLGSTEEAWFFLDSVDEAQLETPRALENAVRVFGVKIHDALERTHIFIASREDAWRALSDQTLIEQHLPYGEPGPGDGAEDAIENEDAEDSTQLRVEHAPMLKVYRLAGLSNNEVALFAGHYGVSEVSDFVNAINRGDLSPLAERPFDLKALIRVWLSDHKLGSRFEVLQRLVDLHLESISAAHAKVKVDAAKARRGIRALAGAVMLTGKAVICLARGTS